MKTYFPSVKDIKKDWILIDAKSLILGRLASYIAYRLKGKHKPIYTDHMDCGDKIVVINSEKIAFSNKKKWRQKVYYKHTGHSGGLKSCTAEKMLDKTDPHKLLYLAVKRMLGNKPISRTRMKNLYLYNGSNHKHEAQKPALVDFGSMNRKNKKVVNE